MAFFQGFQALPSFSVLWIISPHPEYIHSPLGFLTKSQYWKSTHTTQQECHSVPFKVFLEGPYHAAGDEIAQVCLGKS